LRAQGSDFRRIDGNPWTAQPTALGTHASQASLGPLRPFDPFLFGKCGDDADNGFLEDAAGIE